MNKNLLIVVLILLPITIISYGKTSLEPEIEEVQNINVKLKISDTEEIIEIPLEEYIIGVVAAEMPAAFHLEALKAQAIASRTYAVSKLDSKTNYDLIDTIDNQAYINEKQMHEKWGEDYEIYYTKIKQAVEETKEQIVSYDNKIITTYYFAMSNGYTENASLVFQENVPYLTSVESEWDNNTLKNFEVETIMTRLAFCNKLNISCVELDITINERSETNRVKSLKINNKEYSGTEFRKVLEIRSTDFDIEIDSANIKITTRGYGHGVGMSQYGANGMANAGYNYKEILTYYYQNTQIIELNNV